MSLRRVAPWALGLAAILGLSIGVWYTRSPIAPAPVEPPPAPRDVASPSGGEPSSYSAILVRTYGSGGEQTVVESFVARDNGRTRHEWTEEGRRLAVIVRPDLERIFTVDLDRNEYSERSYGAAGESGTGLTGDEVERLFVDPGAGLVVSRERQGTETVDGRSATVYRSRIESLAGGVSESRVWEADDLGGLAIRSELRGPEGSLIVTELRDITTPADPELFELPSGATPRAEAP